VCVARRAQGDRTVPTDARNLASVVVPRKASRACRVLLGRPRVLPLQQVDQSALSIIWVSWPLLTAPIWVASTLPFLNTISVGMPRTL
jgi:hypothetical protein